MIEFLIWDSNFFKLKIGRSTYPDMNIIELETLLTQKRKEEYDLIYLFIENPSNTIMGELEKRGVKLVDKKATYRQSVNPLYQDSHNIIPYTGEMTKELVELSLLSGWDSRFKKDPRLSNLFPELYKTWLEKSLSGEMADVVFVYIENNSILGFVSVKRKTDDGQIGLIAVNDSYQKRGIGSNLLKAVNNWCCLQNLAKCYVVTQLDNINACKLYERNGYVLSKIDYIYHI